VKKVFWITGILLVFVIAGFTFGNVINLTILGGGPADPITTAAVQAFEKLNPDIHITMSPYVYASFNEKLTTLILGHQFPDLVTLTTAYVRKAAPYLLNLNPYIEQEGLTPEKFVDRFVPSMAVFAGATGVVYAVPDQVTVQTIWINKKMWEKAGILPPPLNGQTTPWTWDQWKSALATVKKVNKIPYALGMVASSDRFYGFLTMYGASYLNDQAQFTLDTPQAAEAIDEFLSLFRDNIIPSAEWLTGENPETDFFSGITAAWWSGSWRVYDILNQEKATGNSYAAVWTPKVVNWFGVPGGDVIAAFNTGNKVKEAAAAKFLMWLATEEGEEAANKPSYNISPLLGQKIDYENSEVSEWVNEVFAPEIAAAPAWSMVSRASNIYSELYSVNVKAIQSAIANNWNANQVIQNIKNGYDKIVSGK